MHRMFRHLWKKRYRQKTFKNVHTNLEIKLESFQATIYTQADIPDKLTPPFESIQKKKKKTTKIATKDVTNTPKFRIVLGNNSPYPLTTQPTKSLSSSTSTTVTICEPQTNTHNMLIKDLLLSKSDSESSISSTTTEPTRWIDPKDWIIIDEC